MEGITSGAVRLKASLGNCLLGLERLGEQKGSLNKTSSEDTVDDRPEELKR